MGVCLCSCAVHQDTVDSNERVIVPQVNTTRPVMNLNKTSGILAGILPGSKRDKMLKSLDMPIAVPTFLPDGFPISLLKSVEVSDLGYRLVYVTKDSSFEIVGRSEEARCEGVEQANEEWLKNASYFDGPFFRVVIHKMIEEKSKVEYTFSDPVLVTESKKLVSVSFYSPAHESLGGDFPKSTPVDIKLAGRIFQSFLLLDHCTMNDLKKSGRYYSEMQTLTGRVDQR